MRLPIVTCAAALATAVVAAGAGPKSYDGHKVVRVRADARTATAVRRKLEGLALPEPWNPETYPSGTGIDVVVPPGKLASFEALGLDHQVLHADLGRSIADESVPAAASWSQPGAKGRRQAGDLLAWYDSYHSYEEHIQYFKDLQALFPNNSEPVSTGTSYEGRDLYGLHLWGEGGPGKPAVLYHGTVHAREWISTMVVEYLTLQLISQYQSNNTFFRWYLDQNDFYIFPIVNPDGFVYSQTNDRLWRKSRQPAPANTSIPANESCVGVDINRNWAYSWETNTGGASSDPCSDNYAGPGPSSTPENQGLSALVDRLRGPAAGGAGPGIRLFADFHSYGTMLLHPFGADEARCAPETGRWARTGALVSDVVRARGGGTGTVYTFGPAGAVLYKMTGASHDHVHVVGGAGSSWLVELPDRQSLFLLPPERIRPIAEEMGDGQDYFLYLLDQVFFDGEGP